VLLGYTPQDSRIHDSYTYLLLFYNLLAASSKKSARVYFQSDSRKISCLFPFMDFLDISPTDWEATGWKVTEIL
jgi:hypothetical protein